MSIDVACRCGQRFKAKPALAGKKVKCPKCTGELTIPAPSGLVTSQTVNSQTVNSQTANSQTANSQTANSQTAAASAPLSASSTSTPAPSASATQEKADGRPCPSCGEEVPAGKVVCGNCHYSLRLKRRMRNTEVPKDKPIRGGKKAKQKPKKPMNKPLVFGVAACLVLGPVLLFGLGIVLGPEDTLKMSGLMGVIVFSGGVLWLRLLAAADSESNSVALFNPVSLIYGLVYAANNPRESLPAFLAMALAVVIWIVGFIIAAAGSALTGGV